jgi:ribosomal protein L40E
VTAPQTAPTHACVRCGAPVAIDVGLCERCNPLGLRDSSSSQVHGIAIGGVILFVVILAVVGRFALSGIGPFEASVSAVPDGDALAVTLTVTNQGTSSGQTTCHVSDPADRSGNIGGFVLSPRIDPGQTITFTQRLTEFGSVARPLEVRCSAP